MALTYLSLVNDLCTRVNETELTSGNFDGASGFYASAKEAVNSSIRLINQQEFEWPCNHTTGTQILAADGTVRYSYPGNTKTVDMESFRIRRDNTLGNESKPLLVLDYDEYLDKYVDSEYNTTDTSIRDIPKFVFRTPDAGYGVYPPADKEYSLDFEYYQLPYDLVDHDDSPTLPEAYRHVIVDGAMYYVYFFRGDTEQADRILSKASNGIANLRKIYINNDYEYVRDTRVSHTRYQKVRRI